MSGESLSLRSLRLQAQAELELRRRRARQAASLAEVAQLYGDRASLEHEARLCGLPADALDRFLRAGYVPQPKQMRFHAAARACDRPDGPVEVAYAGVRGEAKSHAALAQIAIDDCCRFPDLKFLLLRRVGKAVRESFEDLRRKIFRHLPHDYRRHEGVLELPNGSRIVLGHFKDESDIDNYLGIEYDGIAVEESTQLTARKHRELKTCLRTSKAGWRPRVYHTTNPGGIGHAHFKQKFVEPWRAEAERDTRFIFAARGDNTFINPEYQKALDELVGWQRAAWRDGDFDIAAGQYFANWRYEEHTCTPFVLPAHWPVWAALDYGFNHPTVAYLLTEADGVIYVVAEHWARRQLPVQNAGQIIDLFAARGVPISRLEQFAAGLDVFSQRGASDGKTIADQYRECGIGLVPANPDRISRAGEILKLLGDPDRGVAPRLKIFRTCVRLIECLPALQHDPHRPEDVLKVDIDEDGQGGDDPYDALGYGVMCRGPRRRLTVA